MEEKLGHRLTYLTETLEDMKREMIRIRTNMSNSKKTHYTNQEVMELLQITSATLKKWRDNKIIGYIGLMLLERFGAAFSENTCNLEYYIIPDARGNGYLKEAAQKIVDIANEKKAEQIVIGLPKNMDGTLGFKAQECTELAERIRDGFENGEVVMWDERCTTVSAHTALNSTNTRGKKRKAVVDAVAAVIILEDYLNYRKNIK